MPIRIILTLFLTVSTACFAKHKTVERPDFAFSNAPNLVIESVELTDTATLLHCAHHGVEGYWFAISPQSHLLAGGKRVPLRRAEGITPGAKTVTGPTHCHHFTLSFPAIDTKLPHIDFIEGDGERAFRIFGITLSKRAKTSGAGVPAAIKKAALSPADDGRPLPMPQWQLGKTTVKGRIYGYRPEMKATITVYPNNALDVDSREASAKVADDGTFSLEVPMYATCQTVFMRLYGWYGPVVLSQSGDCEIHFDLIENSHRHTGSDYIKAVSAMRSPDLNRLYFTGAMADVNNQICTPEARAIIWNSFGNVRSNRPPADAMLTPPEFRDKLTAWMRRNYASIDSLHLTPRAKEVLQIDQRNGTAQQMLYSEEYLKRDNKGRPLFDRSFFDTWKELDLNTMKMAYSGSFGALANAFQYIIQRDTTFQDSMRATAAAMSGADPLSIQQAQQIYEAAYRSRAFGYTYGPLYDLMFAERFSDTMSKETPLSAEELRQLDSHPNTVIRDYYRMRNEQLAATLAERKNSGNYNINATPANSGEELLGDIGRKFAGKTILVDFWGTWCAPCRDAIRRFDSHKKALQEKGIVFVYITDTRSPEDAWHNMSSGMQGEHYRLSKEQSGEIFRKFNFTGWPSYLIIDKDGNFIYRRTGYNESEILDKLNN